MDLDAAMEKAQEHLDSQEAPEVEAAPESAEVVQAEAAPVEETAQQRADRERDEGGRFVKGKPAPKPAKDPAAALKGGANGAAQAAPPAGQGKPAAGSPPAPVAGTPAPETHAVKAPQSWKPAMRELAAKLPAEFHPLLEEVDRRERETTRVLSESAEARKTYEQVQRTLAPYETIARANGMDSMSYAGSVLQTAATLHMGTPTQKAQAFATLIQQFQPDLDAINQFLQGQAPAAAPQHAPQDVSRLVQQEFERVRQEAASQKAAQAWQEFQASAPEFLADVQGDMREILELAGRQGRNMTYQQAYDRACKLNEGVQEVLAKRDADKALRTAQPVTGDALRAASSVKSRPATAPAAKTQGLDAAMNKAREKLGM